MRRSQLTLFLLPFVSATTVFRVSDRGGAFASLNAVLDPGDGIKTEPGALVYYKGGLSLGIKADGAWFGRMFAGESPYFTTLTADPDTGGECMLCPTALGDIEIKTLGEDEGMYLQAGSFLAADSDVKITSEGHATLARTLFSGTGLRKLLVKGPGTVAFNGHGGLTCVKLGKGEKLSVDNGHVVAWSPNLEFELVWAARSREGQSSFFRSVASGEGLMCLFEGPGEVWVQTHAMVQRSSSRDT